MKEVILGHIYSSRIFGMYPVTKNTRGIKKNSWLKSRKVDLGNDYTIRFIGYDSIQTCSFVSERFQSHTMIYREFKRIGQTNRLPSPKFLKRAITSGLNNGPSKTGVAKTYTPL